MSPRLIPALRARLLVLGVSFLAACGGSGLSGTYVASDADGGMSLEFKGGGKVTLTMRETGSPEDTKEAGYIVDGNHITIQVEGGIPLVLVRDGDVLQANMMGQVLRFEKK